MEKMREEKKREKIRERLNDGEKTGKESCRRRITEEVDKVKRHCRGLRGRKKVAAI